MVVSTLPPEEAAPNRSPVLSMLRAQEKRCSFFAAAECNAEWERLPAGANACTLHSCTAAHTTPRVVTRGAIMAGERDAGMLPGCSAFRSVSKECTEEVVGVLPVSVSRNSILGDMMFHILVFHIGKAVGL